MRDELGERLAAFDRENWRVEFLLGLVFVVGLFALFSLTMGIKGTGAFWVLLIFLGWGGSYGLLSKILFRMRVRRHGLVCSSCGTLLIKDLRETAEKYNLCGKCGERPFFEPEPPPKRSSGGN